MKYEVYNTETGEAVTPASLKAEIEALLETDRSLAEDHWAWNAYRYRIGCFAMLPDGSLVLLDKCGNYDETPRCIRARAIMEEKSE